MPSHSKYHERAIRTTSSSYIQWVTSWKHQSLGVCLHTLGDDSVMHFETADMKAVEIIGQINQKTKSL